MLKCFISKYSLFPSRPNLLNLNFAMLPRKTIIKDRTGKAWCHRPVPAYFSLNQDKVTTLQEM